MMLKKSIDIVQGNVLISVSGELYMEEAANLRDQLLNLCSEGHNHFVVDLSDLENMDTTGLGVLISLYKRAKIAGGDVIVRGAQGSVRQLFLLTGMDQVFTLRD